MMQKFASVQFVKLFVVVHQPSKYAIVFFIDAFRYLLFTPTYLEYFTGSSIRRVVDRAQMHQAL